MNSADGKPTHMMIYAHYQNPLTHENKKLNLGDTFKAAYHNLLTYFRECTADFRHMF